MGSTMEHTIMTVQVDDLHPHERNPRIDAAQVEDLKESIKEHGVEVPLVAAPREDGGYVVLAGHRRLTAVHALGLDVVPVDVRPGLTDPREQLAFMATENMHRDQLTAIEEARLFQDMLDLGWKQADVARHTAVKKTRVSERIKLGKLSEATGEKVHRGQISITDALVIAEYAADPDTAAELEAAVGTYSWDWKVSQARARRESAQKRAAAIKAVEKAGGRVVADDTDFVPLHELWDEGRYRPDEVTDDEDTAPEDFEEALRAAHAGVPGHCAQITALGNLVWGSDQADEQHPYSDDTDDEDADEAPVAADPWDEFTAEDLAAARIFREDRIAAALPAADLEADARAVLTAPLLDLASAPLNSYRAEQGASLRRILGAGTTDEAAAALKQLPIATLAFLGSPRFVECLRISAFRGEERFKNRWVWDAAYDDDLDAFLRQLGVEPSDVEKRAWELKNGRPWGTAPATVEESAGDAA